MIQTAPVQTVQRPIARCPHCGMRWVVANLPTDPPFPQTYHCVACSREWRIEDGKFVPVAYHPTSDQRRLLARHDHAARICDSTVRRREVTR